MKLLILSIKSIVIELHLSITVTINTPAHAEVAYLIYPVHLFDCTVTGSAIKAGNAYMLSMVKKSMVLQIVNPNPLDGDALFISLNHFADLMLPRVATFPHKGVTVPTYACIRESG